VVPEPQSQVNKAAPLKQHTHAIYTDSSMANSLIIILWFRTKLKQTEVDCEFLKRCCETLTEENRRLQREVAELRVLKLVAPHHYARMPPPTTLTMCPSCERLASASASADQAGRAGPCWGPLPVFVDGPARRP
jgi:homeobox-leucine zipper protein